MSDPSVLANFLDDCWEPCEAVELLSRLATLPSTGVIACLIVVEREPHEAMVLTQWDDSDPAEGKAARYLWAMFADERAIQARLGELYLEHVRAIDAEAQNG